MWKRIAPLLVVLSVALNCAFISVWAVHMVRAYWPPDASQEGQVWSQLHQRLNVTEEQWRRIEPRLEEFHRNAQAIRTDILHLRDEMIDLIAVDEPNRQAIAAKQEEIRAIQKQMQQLVIEHLLAEKEMLTAIQVEKLFDLLRQGSAYAGLGRMVGLPDAPLLPPITEDVESDLPSPPIEQD